MTHNGNAASSGRFPLSVKCPRIAVFSPRPSRRLCYTVSNSTTYIMYLYFSPSSSILPVMRGHLACWQSIHVMLHPEKKENNMHLSFMGNEVLHRPLLLPAGGTLLFSSFVSNRFKPEKCLFDILVNFQTFSPQFDGKVTWQPSLNLLFTSVWIIKTRVFICSSILVKCLFHHY